MKKGIIKSALAIAAVAAVGLGSYKAYDAYKVVNMSDEELLMAENVEALSEGDATSEFFYIDVFKNWHEIYYRYDNDGPIPTDSVYGRTSPKRCKNQKEADSWRKNGYIWDKAHIHDATNMCEMTDIPTI